MEPSPAAVLGLLAGLAGLAGYVPYVRDILRRPHRTKPDRVAWLIWSAEYCVLLAAQLASGARASLGLVAFSLLGVLVTFGLSVPFGKGSLSVPFGRGREHRPALGNWVLLGLVGLALSAWWFTRNPGVALCLAVGVESAGMCRTIAGAYNQPGTETPLAWGAWALGGLLDLPAVGTHVTWVLYVYPAFFTTTGVLVIIAGWLGNLRQLRREAAELSM
jgi:hypothetical protein